MTNLKQNTFKAISPFHSGGCPPPPPHPGQQAEPLGPPRLLIMYGPVLKTQYKRRGRCYDTGKDCRQTVLMNKKVLRKIVRQDSNRESFCLISLTPILECTLSYRRYSEPMHTSVIKKKKNIFFPGFFFHLIYFSHDFFRQIFFPCAVFSADICSTDFFSILFFPCFFSIEIF